MHLIKVTLFLTFLALPNFNSAVPSNPKWPKSLQCAHQGLEGLAAALSNTVPIFSTLIDCVGYKTKSSSANHLFKYLKIVYDFMKLLLTTKLACGVTVVKEVVKILAPFATQFEKLKCLDPPY